MPKSSATRNNFVRHVFLSEAMPSYGATLQLNFHTAAPLPGDLATVYEPTAVNYAPKIVSRDGAGWIICDPDGTPNAAGACAKTATATEFDEIESGFVGTEEWNHGSVSVVATGQILYSGALTQFILVSALSQPRFPAGTVLFREQ